jgi:hypothetical protein
VTQVLLTQYGLLGGQVVELVQLTQTLNGSRQIFLSRGQLEELTQVKTHLLVVTLQVFMPR